MFVFWLLVQPLFLNAPSLPNMVGEECNCPAVTNLQKTGGTSSSFSFSWTGHITATEYEVWYVRESDSYTSPSSSVTATAHTFNNLSPGGYTFYVKAICDWWAQWVCWY